MALPRLSELRARIRKLPTKVLLRFGALIALVILSAVLLFATPVRDHLTQENMVQLLDELSKSWWAPLVLLAMLMGVALLGLPVSPLVVAGGVTFGAALGAVYNMWGLFLGALASFYLGKFLGRDFVVHMAGDRLKQAEEAFERRGFWPLIQVRFLPIPFAMINYGAALAGVRAVPFLLSSAIGLAPTTLMHTFFAAMIFRSPTNEERLRWTIIYLSCWGFLALLTSWPSIRQAWARRTSRLSPPIDGPPSHPDQK